MQHSPATLPKRVRKHVNPLADQTHIHFDGFSNNHPIILDIGAYKGEFTQQLVGRFGTEYNYIATEIRKAYAAYLESLFANQENVRVFAGDSARNISGLVALSVSRGVEIAYVFVNFPDPWFKEKHKKRRVVTQTFLTELEKYFSTKSVLVFQTDQESLFRDTQELVNELGRWHCEEFNHPLWDIQSHWEQIKIQEEKRIYRMKITLQK